MALQRAEHPPEHRFEVFAAREAHAVRRVRGDVSKRLGAEEILDLGDLGANRGTRAGAQGLRPLHRLAIMVESDDGRALAAHALPGSEAQVTDDAPLQVVVAGPALEAVTLTQQAWRHVVGP